ncbi:MAG: cupin [Lautropia sp.]|nr:cupin [Lautropia sp.]
MQRDEFTALLAAESFDEVVTVAREANGGLEFHAHPFEAKALVLEGDLSIRTEGGERVYRVGDVFHLHANVLHSERYGSGGVTYLVGRKTPGDAAPSRQKAV